MARQGDRLSIIFAALADPTRRTILSRLHHGTATVAELAEPLPISRPAVSQHLRVLEDAGLIERSAAGRWRTCTLRTEPLDDAAAWVDHHRGLWTERFDILEKHLRDRKETTDDH